MRMFKRGLAMTMAILLMLPSQPVMAEELLPAEIRMEGSFEKAVVQKPQEDGALLEEQEDPSGDEVLKGSGAGGFTGDEVPDTGDELSEDEKDPSKTPEKEGTEEEAETEKETKPAEGEETTEKEEATDKEETTDEETRIPADEKAPGSNEENNMIDREDPPAEKTDPSLEEEILDEVNEEVSGAVSIDQFLQATSSNATNKKVETTKVNDDIEEEDLEEDELEDLEKVTDPEEEVKFNLGTHTYSVVSVEDFFDHALGDAPFDEDGSYTINIPEMNAFFPYEVQFTYQDKVTREWFMTPDDQVEIGGHIFYVSASFDGSVVTQMSFAVGDEEVVVYPDEKEFTDEEDGDVTPLSLLPLKSRSLNADLSMYTPVELTMVSLDKIFMGDKALGSGDKVMWSWRDNDYKISSPGDKIDLSHGTVSGHGNWTMIVGDPDQLAADNIRYHVSLDVTGSEKWLKTTIYTQDSGGNRKNVPLMKDGEDDDRNYYDNHSDGKRRLQFYVPSNQLERGQQAYVHLAVDPSVFPAPGYDRLRAYEGSYNSAEEAMVGFDITEKLFNADMAQVDAGYPITANGEYKITLVSFDRTGNATGCLPLYLRLGRGNSDSYISGWLYAHESYSSGNSSFSSSFSIVASDRYDDDMKDSIDTFTLYKGYAANNRYYLELDYIRENQNVSQNEAVTAAYVGRYASVQEAVNAGGSDIKEALFGQGYAADYSGGVTFTIFVGEEVYYFTAKAVEGTTPKPQNSGTVLHFTGFLDAANNTIGCYQIPDNDTNSRYITILVEKDVDLTHLAPLFYVSAEANVYTEGSSTPEISGKNYHDFSQKPVEYSVAAADTAHSGNYWVRIIKLDTAGGQLYINSLEEENAHTSVKDGVIYSTREMFLDGRYDYKHDIVVLNVGKDAIPALSVELVSDQVQLDDYWTLTGEQILAGVDTEPEDFHLNESSLWNQAMLRILPKEGVSEGGDIHGTLTIKSGDKPLMVLTLTGTVGDPGIVTKEIPQAVKYVPYGTMIQNSNKYDWNQVSYELIDGTLPQGMEVRPNGELYGVPKETGDFTFTVEMENSYRDFAPSQRTFTLTVIDNTDENVDAATDTGYDLTQRVLDMYAYGVYEQTMVSQGVYGEFVYIFLDGEKLEEGVDYTSESGSTRITIRSETFGRSNTPGRHTLGIEFRTKDSNTLKRAAQNYEITTTTQSGTSGGGGRRRHDRDHGDTANTGTISIDPKKGYVNSLTGIMTGAGSGYSNWQQDEKGWRLIYADGTAAAGHMTMLESGASVEQVLWERINGAWYAFGADGILKSGWVFDYQLGSWYSMSVDTGMRSGWYIDPADGYTYYLDPVSGKIVSGWRQVDSKWHYFNEIVTTPTWIFDQETGTWIYDALSGRKPYGAMYRDEQTPDGYAVDGDGAWIN